MQTIILILLLAVASFGQVGALSVTHTIDSAVVPKVVYIDDNFTDVEAHNNELKDSVNVNSDSSGAHTTAIAALNDSATVHADSITTHAASITALNDSLAYSNNSGTDSLVRQTSPRITTPVFTSMTSGSVLFSGASGLLSQDNTNFVWDDANNDLTIPRLFVSGGGNASDPVLSKFDDTDTGPFWAGANDFAISAGGQQVVNMHNTGSDAYLVVGTTGLSASDFSSLDMYGNPNATNENVSRIRGINASGVEVANMSFLRGASGANAGKWILQTRTHSGSIGNVIEVKESGNTIVNGNVDADSLSTGNETFVYDEGTFTDSIRAGSCADTVIGTAKYNVIGKNVSIFISGSQACSTGSVSSSNFIYGIPDALQPVEQKYVPCVMEVDSNPEAGHCYIYESGSGINAIALQRNSGTNFTNNGIDGFGVNRTVISYTLD